MAFTPYSGTSGRLAVVAVAPTGLTDVITFAGARSTMIEVVSWKISPQRDGGVPEVLTFESEADAQYTLYPTKLRGGVARWTAEVSCVVDGDTTNSFEKVPFGAALVIDFVYHKGGLKGWYGCKGVVASQPTQTGVTEKTATFTFTVEGSGPLPTPTI